MQTACYFVWPALKFGRNEAGKCQSMKLAFLFGSYPQVLQVADTTQLLLKYEQLVYVQTSRSLGK